MVRKKHKQAPTHPPGEVNEPGQVAVSRQPSSRKRAIAFRLVAVSFPLLMLLAANFVLYLCGVGYDTRVVIPQLEAGNDTTYCLNEYSSMAYYDVRELAGPDPQPFTLPRPQDVYRIIFVGASTVEGFPYYTELAFPRQVEALLKRQLPARRIEILNAGVVGINSFALADLVPRLLQAQPNLIVLYAGHNEFYGPGGVGSTATIAPALYGAMSHLRRWRLYQWLRKTLRGPESGQPLISALPKDLEIGLDSPQFQAAETYFRKHLISIAGTAQRHHVPILFCSVACNLSSQAPVRSIPNPALSTSQADQRDRLLERARTLLDENDYEAALRPWKRPEHSTRTTRWWLTVARSAWRRWVAQRMPAPVRVRARPRWLPVSCSQFLQRDHPASCHRTRSPGVLFSRFAADPGRQVSGGGARA